MSSVSQDWRRSREYRIWRVTVIRRDGHCVCCGSVKRRQAHHIEDASHNKDLRYLPDNGVTLCSGCHTAFHTMYKKSFREKCTQDDWINFLDLRHFLLERCSHIVLSDAAQSAFDLL